MEIYELIVVHAVEMVSGEDEHQVPFVPEERQVLAHRVRRALVPVAVFQGLLSGKDGQETLAELIETVGEEDMAVERLGGELGQDEDLAEAGMETVAERDVDQPETPGDGNGRLAPNLGQGIETRPLAAGQDDGNDIPCHGPAQALRLTLSKPETQMNSRFPFRSTWSRRRFKPSESLEMWPAMTTFRLAFLAFSR